MNKHLVTYSKRCTSSHHHYKKIAYFLSKKISFLGYYFKKKLTTFATFNVIIILGL